MSVVRVNANKGIMVTTKGLKTVNAEMNKGHALILVRIVQIYEFAFLWGRLARGVWPGIGASGRGE